VKLNGAEGISLALIPLPGANTIQIAMNFTSGSMKSKKRFRRIKSLYRLRQVEIRAQSGQ